MCNPETCMRECPQPSACPAECEAGELWADFLAHAATNPLELQAAIIAAVDYKAPGIA